PRYVEAGVVHEQPLPSSPGAAGEHADSVAVAPAPAPLAPPGPPLARLSYSALEEYARCGYRFYVERVLGLPALDVSAGPGGGANGGTERGILVHALLE